MTERRLVCPQVLASPSTSRGAEVRFDRGARRRERMERLSGADAALLYLETPTQHMHVCGTLLLSLEGDCAGDPASRRAAARRAATTIVRRLSHKPAFRRRLADPPLGLSHP